MEDNKWVKKKKQKNVIDSFGEVVVSGILVEESSTKQIV